MSGQKGVEQRSKACGTVVTCLTLTRGFRLLTATRDDVLRRTQGARDALRPAQGCVPPFTHLVTQPVAGLSLENPQRPRRDTLSPGRSECSAVGLLQT